MNANQAKTYTVHGVLAGAYKAEGLDRILLQHASLDDGVTALCGKVKAHNLCDVHETGPVTCFECQKRIAKRGLNR